MKAKLVFGESIEKETMPVIEYGHQKFSVQLRPRWASATTRGLHMCISSTGGVFKITL